MNVWNLFKSLSSKENIMILISTNHELIDCCTDIIPCVKHVADIEKDIRCS